jgi:hypothetical protein
MARGSAGLCVVGSVSIVSLQNKRGSIRGCYLLRNTLPLGGLKRENSISAVDLGCWKDAFQKLTRFILRRVIARLLCSEGISWCHKVAMS